MAICCMLVDNRLTAAPQPSKGRLHFLFLSLFKRTASNEISRSLCERALLSGLSSGAKSGAVRFKAADFDDQHNAAAAASAPAAAAAATAAADDDYLITDARELCTRTEWRTERSERAEMEAE